MKMARYKLEKGAISKRQLSLDFGFNAKHLRTLLEKGILARKGYGVAEASVRLLQEGEHFVVCCECGARQASITLKHLRACSGLTLSKYQKAHPQAPLASSLTISRRSKTEAQRSHQSETLKVRFQTAEGTLTRRQISTASKRLHHELGYREVAADFLRKLNQDPEHRRARGVESKARWESGSQREAVAKWHAENRERSLLLAQHARSHIKRRFSKLHRYVKAELISSGLDEFVTEYEVGYYSIDEALPRLQLAVEVDGCYWHGCVVCGHAGVGSILVYDARKTTYLEARGWSILRLREHEINMDWHDCLSRVRREIQRLEGVKDGLRDPRGNSESLLVGWAARSVRGPFYE
jgi:very-short-patch-repair endonuclease